MPGEQAKESAEDEVGAALFPPTLLRLERYIMQRREEALAQVELVKGCLWCIEGHAASLLVERHSVGPEEVNDGVPFGGGKTRPLDSRT